MANEQYMNFPISLLCGFMTDHQTSLSDMLLYHLYTSSLLLEHGCDIDQFKAACEFYGVDVTDNKQSMLKGKAIYEKHHTGTPKAGLNFPKYWEFRSDYKTDFEKVCLLAFLALKSILGKKPYMKVTNDFLLARMDGKSKACNKESLSPEILKYATEHQTKKIKNALVLNGWGLVTYSRHTRGFYISFKLTLEDLIFEAEKKRESSKVKQLKIDTENARAKAMARLQNIRSP